MLAFLSSPRGNPSSIHALGRAARDALERAREEVGALIGASSGVVFTSGGTEADFLGVLGAARAARAAGRPPRVVSSPLEHPAVRGALETLSDEGFEVMLLPVDEKGRVEQGDLAEALRGGAALVTLALSNHELGNVYDIAALAELAHAHGALFHSDGVQAAGRMSIDVHALGVDLLSLSGHKMHGPKGIGALWVKPGVEIFPLWKGGHQEKGLRPGTENVVGIVGLGEACRLARTEGISCAESVSALRDRLEQGLLAIPGARVNGDRERRVPGTTNMALASAPGELVVIALDLAGVAASTGAACASGSMEPSPVILALGQPPDRAAEAVRFSLGRDNTQDEVDEVISLLPVIVERIRAASFG